MLLAVKWCIFLEFNRQRDLWDFFCYGPRGRIKISLFLSKFMGIARRGVLKESEICDFEKCGQQVNEMMAVAVKNFQNFL